jgi:hypothetical protein
METHMLREMNLISRRYGRMIRMNFMKSELQIWRLSMLNM